MLMIEAVANTLMIVVCVFTMLRFLQAGLHKLVERNLARVAASEARHLDDEWRKFSGYEQ